MSDIEIAIQVNGKTREVLTIEVDTDKQIIEAQAKTLITKWLDGKNIIKVIFVPNRIINFVIR